MNVASELGTAPAAAAGTVANEAQFAANRNWEVTVSSMLARSEKRAWRIAWCAVGVAVMLGAALFFLMPLKETMPFLVRVDNATGVPDIVTAIDSKGVGYDDVIDKYFLAKYVTARESYDWYTIQKDYETVGLMSTAPVGKAYATKFEGKDALDKQYGATITQTIKIISVVPNDRDKGIGTVRYVKMIGRTDEPNVRESTTWTATIGYEYRNTAKLKESSRLINPLGFTVKSFRPEPELIGGGR